MRNVLPRGTGLRTSASQLSVLSYNLLADIYVRPIDERTGCVQEFAAFRWAEPADVVLAWKARMPRLLAELQACEADILCLQEVQYETTATDDATKTYVLPEWLQAGLPGYASFLPKQRDLGQMAERNERVLRTHTPVANALLYRKDRLEPVAVAGFAARGAAATAVVAVAATAAAATVAAVAAPSEEVSGGGGEAGDERPTCEHAEAPPSPRSSASEPSAATTLTAAQLAQRTNTTTSVLSRWG